MVAAEDPERRHVDDERASGLQHALDFRQRRGFFLFTQAVEHVEGSDQIEGGVAERHPGDRRLDHAALSIRVSELEAPERRVEAGGVAELAEHDEVGAGPAAAVQNASVRAPGNRVGDERAHEAAQAFPPEVLLLDSVCGFEQTIHSVLRFSSGCFRGAGLSDADDRGGPPAQAFYPTSIL
jgi:hypothetical protein